MIGRKCKDYEVEGVRTRGRPKETRREAVDKQGGYYGWTEEIS